MASFAKIKDMNKKPIFSAFLLTAALMAGGLAVAKEEPSMSASPMPVRTQVKTRVREEKDRVKTEIKETRDTVKTEIKNTRNTVKAEIKDTREAFKARDEEAKARLEVKKKEFKVKREELSVKLKEKREQLQTQIKEKREELKEKLKTIKNERKKEAVERIDGRLDALNEKMTNRFSDVLKKIDDLLVRIGERANRAEENGVDVSTVRTAIDSASASVEASRAVITAQAGKTYTIAVTTETGLKQDVGKIRQQLSQDLKAVHQMVKAAQEAARKAATTLAQLPKPSPSPSLSPEATESPEATQ